MHSQPNQAELMLRIALVPILTGWAKVAPGPDGRVDADTVEIYAQSLAEIRITVPELESARRAMLRTHKFFPTVAEVTEYVIENRSENRMKGWIDAIDENGMSLVAPPHQVHNGRYVPNGGGNGIPAAPLAEFADIIERIEERREELGVTRLMELPQGEVGLSPLRLSALPMRAIERESVPPERVAELEAEARLTAERKRQEKSS